MMRDLRVWALPFSVLPLLCGCSKTDPSGIGHSLPPSSQFASTPSTSPTPSTPPVPKTFTRSMASFTSDTLLDECIDITIVPPSGVDGSEVLDSLAVVKKSTGVARLSKACGDQFSSNTVLATCTTSGTKNVSKSDAGLPPGSYTFDVVERYYDLDALTHSDAYMKNCLDMKGDWDALDKASPQYQQALRARARRELEKAPKALGP